jgi:hypothetical protein
MQQGNGMRNMQFENLPQQPGSIHAMWQDTRPWKDNFKSDLRSDQDHRQKNDLRSDQEDHLF